ncbi:MAG TPA: GNAT family N-acetyltransferase [Bacteroidia bacterium]|jgi:N-acetylglutamate synthase-like GNAT family acetyltransferase
MDIILREPSDAEFALIKSHIAEYALDDRELMRGQFSAAFRNKELVGFGRLRQHPECTELCSLGVITSLRRKGIGKAIVRDLLQRTADDIYLVCIIPAFFTPFNFRITPDYPASISGKLHYCTKALAVPEEYVVMLRKA